MKLASQVLRSLTLGTIVLTAAACAPTPSDDVGHAEPEGRATRLGDFVMRIDPQAGTLEILDSTTAGVVPVRAVQDGTPMTGPNGSVELVSTNTGNGVAGCGTADTFCADVTLRTFYQETTLRDLEVQLIRITPVTGHAATNADVSAHRLANSLGRWSYGALAPAGGGTNDATVTWNFGDDGVPFTVVGTVWGTPLVCSAPGVAIPDDDAMGVMDTITLTEVGTLQDVDFSVQISHPWVGDLVVALEHLGTTVTAVDRPGRVSGGFGCGEDNTDVTLDDEATTAVEDQCDPNPALNGNQSPNNSLMAFDGESMTGAWTITVSDLVDTEVGTLDSWCLHLRAN